jgi:4-amino-4-deoxy-L-arabinose transferase-like glycosyltransferase
VRSFNARLAGIVLAAVGVRLVAAYFNRHYPVTGDAEVYHAEGRFLAGGEGFRRYLTDVPTAEHPPLHIVLLAGFDLIGAHSTAAQKALLGLVGSVTVGVIGLLGRAVKDETTGLIAAAIAAVYPMLWLPDAALMSETTSMLFAALALLVAYRDRTPRNAALLGAVIALGALTRGELIGLLALLALNRRRAWLTVLACVLVLAPWTIRNALTFDRPVLISSNTGGLLAGANCDRAYYGPEIGTWVIDPCLHDRPPGDEAEADAGYRDRGLDYARDHLDRLPVVMLVRLGRLLDVYRPWTQGVFFQQVEGRNPRAAKAGLIFYWLLLPLGIAGAVLTGRRGAPLLVPVALVVLVAVLTYGSTRFRTTAEPSLVVFSALALRAAGRRAGSRSG